MSLATVSEESENDFTIMNSNNQTRKSSNRSNMNVQTFGVAKKLNNEHEKSHSKIFDNTGFVLSPLYLENGYADIKAEASCRQNGIQMNGTYATPSAYLAAPILMINHHRFSLDSSDLELSSNDRKSK